MAQIHSAFARFFTNTGLYNIHGSQFLMVLIGLAIVFLSTRRKGALIYAAFGFGVIVGNMPAGPVEILLNQNGAGNLLSLFDSLLRPDILSSLLFLAFGLETDFSMLIASPRMAILAGGAQIGVFAALVLGSLLGFSPVNASVAAALGFGHNPPLSIFAAATLNPNVIGAAAVVAFLCARLGRPIVEQIASMMTSPAERRIRMAEPRSVSQKSRILFPVVAFTISMICVPAVRGILGPLFLGNLLRECFSGFKAETILLGSSEARHTIRILVRFSTFSLNILLAFVIGTLTYAQTFISWGTIGLLIVGMISLSLSTAWGILMTRLVNVFSRQKINPLLGAAAAANSCAIKFAFIEESEKDIDRQSLPARLDLLRHAQAANLAAHIAWALTIGIFITMLFRAS